MLNLLGIPECMVDPSAQNFPIISHVFNRFNVMPTASRKAMSQTSQTSESLSLRHLKRLKGNCALMCLAWLIWAASSSHGKPTNTGIVLWRPHPLAGCGSLIANGPGGDVLSVTQPLPVLSVSATFSAANVPTTTENSDRLQREQRWRLEGRQRQSRRRSSLQWQRAQHGFRGESRPLQGIQKWLADVGVK